jgi:hypothetical protein
VRVDDAGLAGVRFISMTGEDRARLRKLIARESDNL